MASTLVPLNTLFTFPGIQPSYLALTDPHHSALAALLRSFGKALSSHRGRSIYLDITVSILSTSSLISSSTPSIPGKLGLYLIFSLYPLMLEKNEELNMLNMFIRLRHSNNLYSLFQINGSPSYILFSLNHNLPSLRIFRKLFSNDYTNSLI